jgi:pimeloyl-ACP methyl ester carboxylesterase
VLICTHGLFRTRVEMLARAMVAAKIGYGVLLYDTRSHGNSEKGVVSLGCHEANDVLGAIQYVHNRYEGRSAPKIVLMGISMGAVTTLLAAAQSNQYVAIVLDSPFSSIEETVVDHSWLFFKLPRYPFTPLFLFWFSKFSGCDPRLVNSDLALKHLLPVPMLFIGSEGDRRIGPNVARHLYQDSDSPMKRIKIFGDDVGHGAAYRLHPDVYAAVLVDFLDHALANGAAGTASSVH